MKKPEKLEKYEEPEKPEKYEKQKKQIRSSLSSSESVGIQIRYYLGSSLTEFVARERERRRIRHPPWRKGRIRHLGERFDTSMSLNEQHV